MAASFGKQREKNNSSRRKDLPVLVRHVMETLPDSTARRQELLAALAALIPPGEASGARVRVLRFHLEEQERVRLDCAAEPAQAPA